MLNSNKYNQDDVAKLDQIVVDFEETKS